MLTDRSGRARILLACSGLGLGACIPARADEAADQAILALANATAARLSLELCRFGSVQYDRSQKPGAFALFRDRRDQKDPQDLQLAFALFKHGDRSWRVKVKDTGEFGWRCTETGYPPKPPLRAEHLEAVRIGDIDEVAANALSLSFFEGDLIITNESDLRRAPSGNTDWVAPRFRWNGGGEPDNQDREYAIVLALPGGSPGRKYLDKLRTFTTLGKTDGPGDAGVDVKAELIGDTMAITISVVDDKNIPMKTATASDADLLKSDHIELWYQTGAAESDIRQLGIARLASGAVHARWLHPRQSATAKTPKVPLPKVTSPAPDRFLLEIPAAVLFAGEPFIRDQRNQIGFTAAFSDTDLAGKRQQTVVATSLLEWGKWESLGKLVWLENGARFPSFRGGSRVEVEVSPSTSPGR